MRNESITKLWCWLFGHVIGHKIVPLSFYSPSRDRVEDHLQPYCTRCELIWPANVWTGSLYYRMIRLPIIRLENWWIFRKYRWTPQQAARYDAFLKHQLENFDKVYGSKHDG